MDSVVIVSKSLLKGIRPHPVELAEALAGEAIEFGI